MARNHDYLTLEEILEAFPEEYAEFQRVEKEILVETFPDRIIETLIGVWKTDIQRYQNDIREACKNLKKVLRQYEDLYKSIEYDPLLDRIEKKLALAVLDMRKPKKLYTILNQLNAMQQLMRNDTPSPLSALDIERAKQFPCGDLVELKKLKITSQRISGCCPLHEDSTPSFFIDRRKNLFHCFSCHKGGDSIQLIMDLNGLKFMDAVRFILEKHER